jgi:hypothetical protein
MGAQDSKLSKNKSQDIAPLSIGNTCAKPNTLLTLEIPGILGLRIITPWAFAQPLE